MSKLSVVEDYILHKREKTQRLEELRDLYLHRSRQISTDEHTSTTNVISNPTEDAGLRLAELQFIEKMIQLVNDLEAILAKPETEDERKLNKGQALERAHMLLLIQCRRECAYSGKWYVKMPYLLAERDKFITKYSYQALWRMWDKIRAMGETLMWERKLK